MSRSSAVHALFATVTLSAVVAYVVVDDGARPVVMWGVIAGSTALGALGTWLSRDRKVWGVATVGLGLLLVLAVVWPRFFSDRLGLGDGRLADVCIASAHLVLLLASVMLIRRSAGADQGGVVDAALLGLLACTPLWQFLVLPRLQAFGAPLFGQVLVLSDVLFLAGVLGALMRVTRINARARPTLSYLLTALVCTMVSVTGGVIVGEAPERVWHMTFLIVAFFGYAAAALHPTASYLTSPSGHGYRGLTRGHLIFLGAVLMVTPTAAIAQTVFDRNGDPLVLAVSSVLAVPLVLLRMAQLSAQRDRIERTLVHHARHDELTGLLNRRAMLEEIDRALALLDAGTIDRLALLFCDLDRFKAVNDRLGHKAGDQLLQVVAGRIVAGIRDVDVVARIGGDEFVVLCPGEGTDAVAQVADRLAAAITLPMVIDGVEVGVGVSVGTAVATAEAPLSREALMAVADAGMYRSKDAARARTGRQRVASGP